MTIQTETQLFELLERIISDCGQERKEALTPEWAAFIDGQRAAATEIMLLLAGEEYRPLWRSTEPLKRD